MPSKFGAFLIVVATVAGVVALTWVERTAPGPRKPRRPPRPGARSAPAVPAPRPGRPEPAEAPGGSSPGRPAPEKPKPPPTQTGPAGEIRVREFPLVRVNSSVTRPVKDTGDNRFVLLAIMEDGRLRWGGTVLGASYAMLGDMMRKAAEVRDFRLVIVTPPRTPWKYVYWALEEARKAGVADVGLGVNPSHDDERTLLAMIRTPPPKGPVVLPEGMEELRVEVVDEDGEIYYLFEKEDATSARGLYQALGKPTRTHVTEDGERKAVSPNAAYALKYGVDYARDPAKTPWVVVADPEIPTHKVIKALEAIRLSAIYTVRFGGEFPSPPGRK